ncbi:MAG TPA: GspE/PulE family protein, partial [Gammaproteobacteria bacterium]|nr:GspE/PulE family protein [Gammaproteobacteria bacterium]
MKVMNSNDELDESIILMVNQVIQDAIQLSVSDIHIEPILDAYRVRYRRDGILREIKNITSECALRVIARLKVLAKLDISEKRLPQDGRFRLLDIDLRINSCPTFHGEKIVLRLLDAKQISLDIDQLGFSPSQKNIFLDKISEPYGLILVTGPTGSGKTVTLYSALQFRNRPEINISTVEDPIEIQLQGINQVNIHAKIGLDFPQVLRALLRQDPDIIMVGEIRDAETAEIAIQAANTGHLVF